MHIHLFVCTHNIDNMLAHQTNAMEQNKSIHSNEPTKTYRLEYPTATMSVLIEENCFVFRKETPQNIGTLHISDIVDYILVSHRTQKSELIEMTMFTKTDSGTTMINKSSPFMNNIDLVMHLHNMLYANVRINSIYNEAQLILLQNFMYELSEFLMDVILNLSETLKNSSDEQQKRKLLHLSVGITYSLTKQIYTQLERINTRYKSAINAIDIFHFTKTKHDEIDKQM